MTRREFVRRSLLLGAGLLLLPLAGLFRRGKRSPLRPVKARWGKKLAG